MKHISVLHDLDIFSARRAARETAQALGFDLVESTAIETAVSELASNALRHAGGGTLTLRPLEGATPGLEMVCEDGGPGIADVEAALRGAAHTPLAPPVSGGRGGLGIGLGGVKRLMDELAIESRPGDGTRITARKWATAKQGSRAAGEQRGRGDAETWRRGTPHARHNTENATPPSAILRLRSGQVCNLQFRLPPWHIQIAAASRPAAGTSANGDGWLAREADGRLLVALADGLGHGDEAARVAQKAITYIEHHRHQSLTEIMQGCHEEIRDTRGVVLGLARFNAAAATLTYAGIGNTGIRLASPNPARPISLSGIVGYTLRRVREETFPCAPGDLIAMFSDGISERFDLETLLRQTPDLQELAERLVAEHGRENDDATVIVARVMRDA